MTSNDLTKRVMVVLGLTDYHYDIVNNFVLDGIDYLKSSGVKDDVIYSQKSVGVLVQYTTDVWNLTQGQSKLSPFFKERVIQLSMMGDEEDV